MFIATRRATVLVPSPAPGRPDLKHLFILLNDPDGEDRLVLIVSISTVRDGGRHDQTCLLYPGDHPFIQAPSYVMYAMCRLEPEKKLRNGVDKGIFVPRDPMDSGIFARICNGVLDSGFTSQEFKLFFSRLWKR